MHTNALEKIYTWGIVVSIVIVIYCGYYFMPAEKENPLAGMLWVLGISGCLCVALTLFRIKIDKLKSKRPYEK